MEAKLWFRRISGSTWGDWEVFERVRWDRWRLHASRMYAFSKRVDAYERY